MKFCTQPKIRWKLTLMFMKSRARLKTRHQRDRVTVMKKPRNNSKRMIRHYGATEHFCRISLRPGKISLLISRVELPKLEKKTC